MAHRRTLAAAMLFAALGQAPADACSFIVHEPVVCMSPVLPYGAPVPTQASILAQAKAEVSAGADSLECQSKWLDEQFGHTEERLRVWLAGDDPLLRMLAAAGVAHYPSVSMPTVDSLLRVLSDPDWRVARLALGQAVRLVLTDEAPARARLNGFDPVQKDLLAAALLKSPSDSAMLRLARVHPPLAGALVARLASSDPGLRHMASSVLAALPALDAEYLPAVCAATHDSNPAVVAFAAKVLARAGDACVHGAWVRMLAMPRPDTSHCGYIKFDEALSNGEAWPEAKAGLVALGKPGLHALLVAASAQEEENHGLMWAIARFGIKTTSAADTALLVELTARFPDSDLKPRRDVFEYPLRWQLGGHLVAAILERWLDSHGDERHAFTLGKLTPEHWSAADAASSGQVGKRLLNASSGGTPARRAFALELLGARYFDTVPPPQVLAAARRALDDRDAVVAGGGLVALTSFQLSARQVRALLRGSALVKGKDVSALARALESHSDRVNSAAVTALGVLKAPHVGAALGEVRNRSDINRLLLVDKALEQIAGITDDRLPWARHLKQYR